MVTAYVKKGSLQTKPLIFLERLSMRYMYALERWPTGANQEGRILPCLKHIYLTNCDKLNVVFHPWKVLKSRSAKKW